MIDPVSEHCDEWRLNDMINPKHLVNGRHYFLTSYYDDDLSVPDIKTYCYVGKNLFGSDEEDKADWWYFQNPETFLRRGPFITLEKGDWGVLRADRVTLETMFDLAGLIEELAAIGR